jgi:hypothetical protein
LVSGHLTTKVRILEPRPLDREGIGQAHALGLITLEMDRAVANEALTYWPRLEGLTPLGFAQFVKILMNFRVVISTTPNCELLFISQKQLRTPPLFASNQTALAPAVSHMHPWRALSPRASIE